MHKKRIRNKLAKRYKKEAIGGIRAFAIARMNVENANSVQRVRVLISRGAGLEAAQAILYYVLHIKNIWQDVEDAKRVDKIVFYREKMGYSV